MTYPSPEDLYEMWTTVMKESPINYNYARAILLLISPEFKQNLDSLGLKGKIEPGSYDQTPTSIGDIVESSDTSLHKRVWASQDWDAKQKWHAQVYQDEEGFILYAEDLFVRIGRPDPIRLNYKDPQSVPDNNCWEPEGVVILKVDFMSNSDALIKKFKFIMDDFSQKSPGQPKGIKLKEFDAKLFYLKSIGNTATDPKVTKLYESVSVSSISVAFRDDINRIKKFIGIMS